MKKVRTAEEKDRDDFVVKDLMYRVRQTFDGRQAGRSGDREGRRIKGHKGEKNPTEKGRAAYLMNTN
jgi:hypothetical protein